MGFCNCHSTICGCHSQKSSSVPGFFPTSTEVTTGNLIGAGEVTVLTLDVSPPLDCFGSSTGLHQVKLDSTVELLLAADNNPNYNIIYRLRRSDLVAPLATLQISRRFSGSVTATHTEIPNLTWNNIITAPVTYTVTIQVVSSAGLTSVTAQTRSLNAIVF